MKRTIMSIVLVCLRTVAILCKLIRQVQGMIEFWKKIGINNGIGIIMMQNWLDWFKITIYCLVTQGLRLRLRPGFII